MVAGIIPAVGVPLTLISQGGTSIVVHLLAFGVILQVRDHNYESNKIKLVFLTVYLFYRVFTQII